MLKKKLISLFVAITLVLTTCLPSVTFATNNDAQTETMEEVSKTNEEVPEVDEEDLEEESVHCVECDSENVSLLVPLLNLYHCEDCGKYFTVGANTNKKTVSEQVSAVEEDAKKEANEAIFGINNSIIVTYIIFQNNKNQGTKAYTYDDRDTATYPEINDTGVFGELTTEFPGWIFKGYATTATGPVVYKPGDKVVAKRLFTVYEKETYKVNVYKNDVDDGKGVLLDSAEFEYGGEYVYEKEEPTREGYVFLGWSEDKDAVEPECTSLKIDKVTKSVDYYAIWRQEFGIKYPGLELEKYEKGSDVVLKDTFDDKKGYTLEGWSEEEGAIEVVFELGATIENIDRPYNLYPVYLPIDCDIIVGDETSTVKYDSEFTLPETYEEKEGYTFVGFETTSEDYKDKYDKGETFTVKGNATFTPVYEAKGIEVKFIINGEVYKTVEVKYDSKLNKPTEPEVAHYTFDGWFADEDLTEEFNFDEIITVTEGFNVYAKLDADKFDIKFDTDGGTEIEKVNLSYGDKLAKPEDPEKKGHTFEKWTLDGADYDFDSIVEEAFTLKAVYTVNKYEVKVGDNETTLEEYGTEYTLPDTYEIEDFTKKFVGFKDQDGKTYNPGEKFTVPDKKMTFEVVTKDKDKFTVEFYDGNDEYVDKKLTNVIEGTKVSAPVVEKVGHTFVNWFEDKAFTKAFDFNKEITKDVKVYAKFDINEYTIKVGDVETKAKFGTVFTLPNEYEVEYTKVFEGFKEQEGELRGLGYKFDVPDHNVTFDVVIRDKSKYEVHFYDGSIEYDELALLDVYEGETIELPTVSKTNYIFKGWYEDKALNNKFDNANTIEKTMNLYAKFESSTFTVEIEGQDKQTVNNGSIITLPNTFVVTDKTKKFTGWKDQDSKTYSASAKVTINKDMKFTAVLVNKSYATATFYSENTAYASVRVYEDETLVAPKNPTKTYYEFKGWVTTSGENYIFGKALTADIRLYAKFEKNVFTVEIEGKTTQNINKGQTVTLPSTFNVTDNTKKFTGWKDQDSKTYSASTKVTINKDMKFTAVIVNKSYATLTFYDGSSQYTTYTQTVYEGEVTKAPTTKPTKTGYTFSKWVDSNKNAFTFGKTLTTNTKLSANWTELDYSISYNLNGGSWSGSSGKASRSYSSSYTLPTNVTRSGYRFDGWTSNGSKITKLSANNTNTYTLTAKWVRRYTVVTYYLTKVVDNTYYYSWNTRAFDENTSYTKPTGVVNNNTVYHYLTENGKEVSEQEYTFKGFTTTNEVNGTWYSGDYNKGKAMSSYNEGFKITGDVTIYATYNAKYTFVGSLQLGMSKGYGSNQTALTHAKRDGYTSASNLQVSKGPTKKSDDKDQYAVYIGYKKTTNPNHAIKDVFAEKYGSAHHDNHLVKDGHDYYRAVTSNSADMRRGHGGDYQYLFYTKDVAMGKPIKTSDFKMTTSTNGTVAKWWYKGSSNAKIGAKKGSTWSHYLKLR